MSDRKNIQKLEKEIFKKYVEIDILKECVRYLTIKKEKTMRDIDYIVIHHSGTEDGSTNDWGAIRRWHINHNKWKDIGYHFGIEKIGNMFDWEVLVGRPLDQNGAHAPGRNQDSIGICFVGNYDMVVPSNEMIKIAVKRLIVPLMKTFDIPVKNILKHSNVNATNCPGLKFNFHYLEQQVWKYL